MPRVPTLQLTHGQVAWALCSGQNPDRRTLDALRYLRQLGVPFTEEEQGTGRGNRLTYTFDHLIECAVAMYAIRRGMKPRQGADFLVGERKTLRKLYRSTFASAPPGALDAPWVLSRGKLGAVLDDEHFIRLHKRHADTSGKIDAMSMDEVITFGATMFDQVERYANEVVALVPLRRVMYEALAWAALAPITPPGRVAATPQSRPIAKVSKA